MERTLLPNTELVKTKLDFFHNFCNLKLIHEKLLLDFMTGSNDVQSVLSNVATVNNILKFYSERNSTNNKFYRMLTLPL